MELKKGELRVFYRCAEEDRMLDSDLDLFLIEALKVNYGYESWASGTALTTGVRELAFEKEKKGETDEDSD